MKTLFHKGLVLLVALALISLTSCDKNFEVINTNPNAASTIDPAFQLSYTQLQTSGERYENWRAMLIYSSTMIQHLSAMATYWSGDKYLYNAGYSSSLWDRGYRNYIKDLVDLTRRTAGDPALTNMNSVARIWKVVAFHRLTDLYGDIPYSEAGLGFLDANVTPKYDAQSAIYADMLKELEEACAALNAGGDEVGGDLIYAGDIAKWKKFGYSMMLRLGMRMSKVDPAGAQAWVQKAITGGVMTDVSDAAYIQHTDGEGINRNGIGEVFQADANQRMSATFINWMKDHNDPRLDMVSTVNQHGVHNGLPNGFDATMAAASLPGGDTLDNYSAVNATIVNVASPMVFQTYAEVEFLLAEATVRNWNSGDAKTHYENGVTAAMKAWGAIYDATLDISDADINDYIAANPYDAANAMEQIGEQYWAATFLNEYEAYANYRRTGYPALVDVVYNGNESGGKIPRRLRYPAGEAGVNADNYNAVLSAQGPDAFTTRIWWDAN